MKKHTYIDNQSEIPTDNLCNSRSATDDKHKSDATPSKKHARPKFLIPILLLLLLCLLCLLGLRLFTGNITTVKYLKSGGIAGRYENRVVFRDGYHYYLYDTGDVYRIPMLSYYKIILLTQRLHLDQIDGYSSTRNACDAFYTEFGVLYRDGTIVSGNEYCSNYPDKHDAHKLESCLNKLTLRFPSTYEVGPDKTCNMFQIRIIDEVCSFYQVGQKDDGGYFLYYSNSNSYEDFNKDITEAEYKELYQRALPLYQKGNPLVPHKEGCSYIGVYSPIWGTMKKDVGNSDSDLVQLCEDIRAVVEE